jgi:hypothetical protein
MECTWIDIYIWNSPDEVRNATRVDASLPACRSSRAHKCALATGVEGGEPRVSFRGVTRLERERKWVARVWTGQKQLTLGRFDSDVAAAQAYDREVIRLRGADAQTNFPPQMYAALPGGAGSGPLPSPQSTVAVAAHDGGFLGPAVAVNDRDAAGSACQASQCLQPLQFVILSACCLSRCVSSAERFHASLLMSPASPGKADQKVPLTDVSWCRGSGRWHSGRERCALPNQAHAKAAHSLR